MDESDNKSKSLLSWNCRGLRNKKSFLEKYIWDHRPLCIAIQETKLKKDSNFKMSNYSFTDEPLEIDGIAQGGVGFLVHDDIVYHRIKLQTNFQAIAIHAYLHKRITICNIYINPLQNFSKADLQNLAKQLPKPFIITGDFNSHHTLWYDHTLLPDQEPGVRAKTIENFVLENDLNILDKDEHTYEIFRDGQLYTSHIDLTLISPELQPDLDWTTLDETGGSDHIPIVIDINKSYDFNTYTKWNFKRANWDKYRELAIFGTPIQNFENVQDLTDYIVNTLNSAADQAIGKIKIEKGKTPKPWWNDQCKKAVQNKKKAYRKLKRNPCTDNNIEYKKMNAIAVKIVKKSKQENWNTFLSSINSNTPAKDVWGKINAIKGQNKNKNLSSIKTEENIILDQKIDIANALGKNYQNISNGQNSSESFKKYREKWERNAIFKSNPTRLEEYNVSIKLRELKNILKTSGDTAPGADGIPYILIRQLSENSIKYLLDFYNHLYMKHYFPDSWKEAIVIPILKPGKDSSKCSSYRPIALISCLSKIMEKIINKRLMWYLEKNKFINKSQCGFRKGRCTTDHLTRLTSDILEALVNNEYHISIFLDLEKAYDTVWKQIILNQLEKFKINGHLALYIQNFLEQRSIKVKVGNYYSEKLFLDLGVPQGSSISVTLFLIAINTIIDFIPNSEKLQTSLFVDDCRISLRAAKLDENTIKELQSLLTNLQTWASQTGFKFAEGKSEVLICTRKIGEPPKIDLTLDNKKLKIVREKKFLGVWFDSRMTWNPQLKHVKDKCIRALRLLKTLAFSKTKTDTKMLLRIYKTMILPKLEYGCLSYRTASKTKLENMLDPIHHHGLRLCLGAFHTTPKESLYVESNLHSLSYRRTILGIKYLARTQTINKNETICNLTDERRDKLFTNSKIFRTPAKIIKDDMDKLDIEYPLPPILEQTISKTPPWIIPEAKVCFEMENFPKSTTPTREVISEFLKHRHNTDIDIYTDGSKTDTGVGAGIAIRTSSNRTNANFSTASKPQNTKSTILSAELKAISMGLDVLSKLSNKTCSVYSDSKGALQSILQYDPKNPIAQEIQQKLSRAFAYSNRITFCWIPAHCGIPGNERADELAKQASKAPTSKYYYVVAKDLNAYINKKGKSWLQYDWNSKHHNKLNFLDKNIGEKNYHPFDTRLDEVKYNRIRLGHARLTNKYLPGGEEPPQCIICPRTQITIKHIFTNCPLYEEARKKFFGQDQNNFVKNLDRKSTTNHFQVIKFLKYTDLYGEI